MSSAAFAIFVKQSIAALLPPFGLIWLALAALLLALRADPRRGRKGLLGFALACLLVLLVICTPWVGSRLIDSLESQAGPALDEAAARLLLARREPPQAIVILGAGMHSDAREKPNAHTLKSDTLERVHAGAQIARWTHLPVVVSGGEPLLSMRPEASLMAEILADGYRIKPRWVESASLDTAGNAALTARLLAADGVQRIILVTHAYHMLRAREAFERAGMKVTGAPFGYLTGRGNPQALAWLPRFEGAVRATFAIHEWVGWLWYRLRGRSEQAAH